MRILIYGQELKRIGKSGIGAAIEHQMRALTLAGVEWTRDVGADVDVAHINTLVPAAYRTLLRCSRQGIATIVHTHTTQENFNNTFAVPNWTTGVVKRAVTAFCARADQVLCPSEYALGVIRSYGVTTPAETISNGVDTQRFTYSPDAAQAFLQHYKLRNPLVLSVGMPVKRKGIFDFCEVAEALSDHTFVWLGPRLGRMLPRANRRLLAHPPANVVFPGFVPDELIVGAYSASDVFFFPSYEETEGIVVLEALSTGRAIVIRDIPVFEGWMVDGLNCRKAQNNEAYARLISALTDRPEAQQELGARARVTAEERDLAIVGEQLKAVYRKVLDRR